MKKRLRLFTIVSSVLLLVSCPRRTAWSCGPNLEIDETRVALFMQDVAQVDGLSSFYYTEHFLNERISDGKSDRLRNAQEWAAFTWGAATVRDIDTVLYGVEGNVFENNEWKQALAANTFVKWLLQPKNSQALDYFLLAKKVENQAGSGYFGPTITSDQWNLLKDAVNYDKLELLATALAKCKENLPVFLKHRYAFQAVKMMYYTNYYSQDTSISDADGGMINNKPLIETYEKYLGDSKSIVGAWGRLYYALSFADKRMRAIQLLRTFHACEEKKTFIYSHLPASDIDIMLVSEKDKELLAAAYAYKAIKTPGRAMKEMQEVYKLAPQSDYLKLLIVRELAKLDNWIYTPAITGFTPGLSSATESYWSSDHGDTTYAYFAAKNLKKDKEYVREVTKFLLSAKMGKENNDLRNLALVHLYHLDRNFSAASALLAKMPAMRNKEYAMQYSIEKTINIMHTRDILQNDVKDLLCKEFRKMAEINKPRVEEQVSNSPVDYVPPALCVMLSKRYQELGSTVTAGLLFKKAGQTINEYYGCLDTSDPGFSYWYIDYFDKHASPEDIDSLLAFRGKKNKTTFERYITPIRWGKTNWYVDLKGTLLTRLGRFEDALTVFQQLPDDYWQTTGAFQYHLKYETITSVGTLLPNPSGSGKFYKYVSKKDMVREIVSLQRKLQAGVGDAEAAKIYFWLGNAMYNMSYSGLDWMLCSYGKSYREFDDDVYWQWAYFRFHSANKEAERNYYECANAKEMYLQALAKAGNNKELTAQVLLMLVLADNDEEWHQAMQKRRSTYRSRNSEEGPYISPYVKMLKNKCGRTSAFEWASTNCPDIMMAVN